MSLHFGRILQRLWGQPYLLLTLTTLFWASNIVVGRAMMQSLPPVTFAFLRWAGAFLFLLPLALPHLRREALKIRRALPRLLLLALTGIALNNAVAYLGLRYTEATNALVLQSVSPLMIALCSYLLYRERLTGRQSLGLALSFAGVLTVISRGAPLMLLQLKLNRGDLFILTAIASYALYSALLRERPKLHSMSLAAMTFGLGALLLLPVAAGELAAGAPFLFDLPACLGVLYAATFPSLVSFLAFNRGVELIGANRAGVFFHLMPPFGAVLAMLFLGERPALFHGIGFALILSGVGLAAGGPRLASQPKENP